MKKITLKHARMLILVLSLIFSGSSMYATSSSSSGSNYSQNYKVKKTFYSSKAKILSRLKNKSFFFKLKKSFLAGKKPVSSTPAIPLDGGLSILLLGAAAFGAKKLRSN